MMEYGNEIDGVIIFGTGYTPSFVLNSASFICGWLKLIRGERYRSPFLQKLAFSKYLERIDNPRTNNDWLTRDEAIVDKYNADKYCTYMFTANG